MQNYKTDKDPKLSETFKKNVEDAAYKYNADRGKPKYEPIPIDAFNQIVAEEVKKHNAKCEQIRDNN